MAELTRRGLLGSAAGALGGAAALSLLPPSVQKAVAAEPPRHGSLRDIEHVVLLMQENRSFDENDGLFDHVPPPTPSAGTPDEFVQGLPIGGGFRVPAIIVSPWTVGGWVATEAFDHTSALQFLERPTGVEEPNVSDWRRSTFGDFTSAFRFPSARPRPPRLPEDTAEQLAKAKEEVATLPKPTFPGADQTFPHQSGGGARTSEWTGRPGSCDPGLLI